MKAYLLVLAMLALCARESVAQENLYEAACYAESMVKYMTDRAKPLVDACGNTAFSTCSPQCHKAYRVAIGNQCYWRVMNSDKDSGFNVPDSPDYDFLKPVSGETTSAPGSMPSNAQVAVLRTLLQSGNQHCRAIRWDEVAYLLLGSVLGSFLLIFLTGGAMKLLRGVRSVRSKAE